MTRFKKALLLSSAALVLLLFSLCKKTDTDFPTPDNGLTLASVTTASASIPNIQNYNDAIVLGTLDLLHDNLFITSAIDLATTTEGLGETSDFYAHYDEIATIFANNNRNLLSEMLTSLSNHTTNASLINMLQFNGLQYASGCYSLRPRLFLINLDAMSYQSPSQIARLMFSDLDLGSIPIWTYNQQSGNYTKNNTGVEVLEENPVWVVSSTMTDIRNGQTVDNVFLEAGGKKKCKTSQTTGWCAQSGKKCKCDYANSVNEYETNLLLANKFINGTLDPDYYIQN